MKSIEITSLVTLLADGVAGRLSAEKIALIAAVLVQLGDTLATIAAVKSINENK